MNKCKYKIKSTGISMDYTDLLNYIDDNVSEWVNAEDIVFSLSPKQEAIFNKLKFINQEYRAETKARRSIQAIIDSEPDIKDSTSFSVNEFIDNPECRLGDAEEFRDIVTQRDEEAYRRNFIAKQVKELKISEEEAAKKFDVLREHQDIVLEDAIALHPLLTSRLFALEDREEAMIKFEKEFENVATPRFAKNTTLADYLFNGIKFAYMKNKGAVPESKAIHNLNLKHQLNNNNHSIFGHIDHLFIDTNGVLHLYNYKISSQRYHEWPSAKVEKYKALLVFLKYLLAAKGINVKGITLNIVPVYLQYNSDYSKIQGIYVQQTLTYSTNKYNNGYALENYDKMVSYFLPDNYVPDNTTKDDIDKANDNVKKIFPDLNIKSDGIGKTTEEWIRTAPNSDPYKIEPLVIENVDLPNHAYNVIIRTKNGTIKTIPIKSGRRKNENSEIFNVVKEYVTDLADNKNYFLNIFKNTLKATYEHHDFQLRTFSEKTNLNPTFINAIFSKYFTYKKGANDKIEYDWELVEDLSEANILVFKHRSGQIDFVTLSSFDLNATPKRLKDNNLLGYYKYNTQTDLLKGDFGNIELIKTLVYINQIAPKFGEGTKFGRITVINPSKAMQRTNSIRYLNRTQFTLILETVNPEYQNDPIINNLKNCKFVSELDTLVDEFVTIMDDVSEYDKDMYLELGMDKVVQADKYLVEHELHNLISNIYEQAPYLKNPEDVSNALNDPNPKTKNLANLLILASNAYNAVRGLSIIHKSAIASMDKLFFTALTVPDENIRIVAENLQVALDTIAGEFMDQFFGIDEDGLIKSKYSVNQLFENFFEAIGFSQSRGNHLALNNEASQFSNLFEVDKDTGLNLMIFKNPYKNLSDKTYLSDAERTLLKHVLFGLNSITNRNNFHFSNVDSKELIEYANKNESYFWVPLTRASKATSRLKISAFSKAMKYAKKLVTANYKERFDEVIDSIQKEESELLDNAFELLYLKNTFSTNMPIGGVSEVNFRELKNKRNNMLREYGPEFFETNVKNIFIEYLFKNISTEQYNKFLIGTKALLLELHLSGNFAGNEKVVQQEIEHIKDYIKVNVFNRSILEDRSKKVLSIVLPIKSKVTDMLLMGNLISALRDTIQGVLENYTRSIIKFNTDITPANITKAYTYVTTHSTSNARAINLLSKLCLKYRLSNTDTARPSERAKSDRNGIFTLDNTAYGTLKGPDFLNRMTLFVARCMQDGCWDAISLDENGNIKYDWRKDKRFNLLASNTNTDSDEYRALRSLYFSKIREYNQEHPNKEPLDISLDTDLPSPYSNKDIVSIKSLADNIYGSYDKSKKGMYENWALGISLGMFTTWFNGIYVNYFAKPGRYSTNKLEMVQARDEETGELLYVDNKTREIVTNAVSEDGTPNDKLWDNIPALTQGIFPTIGTLWKILRNNGLETVKEYLKANPYERANLRKLLADLLVGGLFALLFKGILSGEYKDYKKEMKENPLLLNLAVEILYKSSSRSYDSFLGPINVIQQLGDNMNPPYYSAPIKLLQDTWSTVFGTKQFNALMTDNFGFCRAFSDALRAERKKD